MADYKALYRKWRPVDFDDVCGQERITDILKYEVANDKVSHAYLFCGSRGTGKTSCAKILAKAINCENSVNGNPCNKCEACRSIDSAIATDVIEMDAASNNGVDNVRNLKDEISFTPALLKYRVYIIDEVHMMSGAAFNALLKTLEEPPQYVVFILATTEFHKLPTTIVSRCQRFDFRRISSDIIVSRLMKIAKSEEIDLGEDGARLIARAARGGMRDAVSLLELCAGSKVHIDADFVATSLGTGDRNTAYELIVAIGNSDFEAVYKIIN
ncbi:MAG: DNA polymerase III subunit gamma/tau, partial [Clostridia bacterium]|nr:DNA polymerase III subunit gamma/tau [Clostridia bacterium]